MKNQVPFLAMYRHWGTTPGGLPSAIMASHASASLFGVLDVEIPAISDAMVPGVVMRSGFSYLDPAKTADLIGIRDRRYLDLTARLLHRSVADIARYGSMCWASNGLFRAIRLGCH